jgi:hypothetical protein
VPSDLELEVIFEISGQHADQPAPDTSQLACGTVWGPAYCYAGCLGDIRCVRHRVVRHGHRS